MVRLLVKRINIVVYLITPRKLELQQCLISNTKSVSKYIKQETPLFIVHIAMNNGVSSVFLRISWGGKLINNDSEKQVSAYLAKELNK